MAGERYEQENQGSKTQSKGMSGKPITSKPVYGYLMDEDENFIIDEEAAPVVKQIYSLCLAGNGPTKIARMLTEQEIPTPGTLEYRRTGSTRRYHPGYECKWATNTVVHILENREYMGCLVNFKTEKAVLQGQAQRRKSRLRNRSFSRTTMSLSSTPRHGSVCRNYASSASVRTAMMKWACSPACCSAPTAAASCISSDTRTTTRKQDCYICGNYKKRTHDCTAHFIRTDLLTAGVTRQSAESDQLCSKA